LIFKINNSNINNYLSINNKNISFFNKLIY